MHRLPDRPFLARELADIGLTPSRVRRMTDDGEISQVFRGVYLPAALPDDFATRLAAVRLSLGSGQIACDRTAAWLHGIDLYRYGEYVGVPQLEFCVRRGRTRTRVPMIHGMTRDLADSDIEERSGVVATSPLRTALDLGAVLYRKDALAALDQYRRMHGVTVEQLVAGIERYKGRRGVRQLRDLVPLSDPRAESIRETWMRFAIHDAGLPAPEPQYWWRETFRLDLAYARQRVAVEYDGEEFHLTPEQERYDARRRALLRDDGWTLIVVRNGDFTGQRLETWISDLREALAARMQNNRRW